MNSTPFSIRTSRARVCAGSNRSAGSQRPSRPIPTAMSADFAHSNPSQYLRNQLLRDADWAGMAHSLEIRVPLVDVKLLTDFAPTLAALTPGQGKAALAHAPSVPLPDEIVARAKTGFGVPTGDWMAKSLAGNAPAPARGAAPKGLVSRSWSQIVLPHVMAANENSRIEALAS